MNLIILATFLVLCLIVAVSVRSTKNKYEQEERAFWEKERAANSVRRKSLDGLDYITIPMDRLPTELHIDNDNIASCIDTIGELSKSPIVNLTGISNTDLKLKYGAPNITLLTLYDQRYTLLASTLQKWAAALMDLNEKEAARTVLEYAVSTKTDVSSTYKTLASLYSEAGDTAAIEGLIPVAESLSTPLKDSIVSNLKTYLD
ncbi:MAG: hypothetical protein J5509_05415 [Lachnospiraceae bacterium]|nr:hypothetical protein [Lachnospiraceae bacterium]